MENLPQKSAFLKDELVQKLTTIDPATKGHWGVMNVHQMIEHLSYAFREANGKETHSCITTEEHLPRMQAFLAGEKPFRENTPNKLLPDIPPPPVHSTVEASLAELAMEIDDFFELFEKQPGKIITNPHFGDLNYDMWIQLLHKHALHHLRQFGANV